MKTICSHFILGVILISTFSCKQPDKEEAKEQFRERSRSGQAVPEQQHPEPAATTAIPSEKPEPVKSSNKEAPATLPGDKVIAVKDGDTFDLLRNGQKVTVRLYGVDSPEKKQAYGTRSQQFASELAFGKQVRLVEHNKDRYGRIVGTIMLPDGKNLNEELVRNGFAWHYKEYSKDKNLEILEADARRYKRGLWQDPNPTPPWEYRKNKVSAADLRKQKAAKVPLPAGAKTRIVYICNSSGATVYHLTKDCHNLKRCTADILTVTEAIAIREHGKRADKSCSKK